MTIDHLTTDDAGCSRLALAIAQRICGLDIIANRPWTEDYDHAAFAAEVARMVDQELNRGIIDPDGASEPCEDCGQPCGKNAQYHEHSFWTCGCTDRKD